MNDGNVPDSLIPDISKKSTNSSNNKSNGLAIAGLVLGILSLVLLFVLIGPLLGVVAIILSAIALGQIKKNEQKGKGMAVAGIVLGIMSLIFGIFMVIGAMAYFGVLDPSGFLPERCTFGAELQCNQYQLTTTEANLQMTMMLPDTNFVNKVSYSLDGMTWHECASGSSEGFIMNRNTKTDIVCKFISPIPQEESMRVQMKMEYSAGTSYDENFNREVYGEVYAPVR